MVSGTTLLDKSFRVIIADGQEIFRNGLQSLLDGLEGFHVIAEVDNGSDLFQQLRSHDVDLVLVDIALPKLSGLEWLQSLYEAIQPSAVILFSDSIDRDLLLQAFLSGVGGFLTRDLPKKVVTEALRCWQRGSLALTPMIAATLVQSLVSKCQELEKVVREITRSSSHLPYELSPTSIPVIADQVVVNSVSDIALQKLTHQ
ncbi:MAG TPA: response regulator transcription factor, partial [Ktedonobacteraceae bacterium]|nr:response regulator transcription factor [Ktedonobacteraceae bacterium]